MASKKDKKQSDPPTWGVPSEAHVEKTGQNGNSFAPNEKKGKK